MGYFHGLLLLTGLTDLNTLHFYSNNPKVNQIPIHTKDTSYEYSDMGNHSKQKTNINQQNRHSVKPGILVGVAIAMLQHHDQSNLGRND